jgi:hypothetical protein
MTARLVAFIGCLVSALLPLGQMPKKAGPCGRELCECVVQQPQKTKCSERPDCPFRAPEAEWVFDGPTFSASIPATILITVLSEFKTPDAVQVPQIVVQNVALENPQARLFALTFVTDEISTPPPRA